jgi:hypothetical protein
MDGGAWMTTGRLEKVDAGAGVAVGGSGRWTPWPEWPPAGMGVSELLALSLYWTANIGVLDTCFIRIIDG